MLKQCNRVGWAGTSRPRPTELDLGRANLQRRSRFPISLVSTPCIDTLISSTSLTANRIVAIILAFVCFVLLATFPGWHYEHDDVTGSDIDVKPFPSRPVCQVALALIFVSSVFVLVSVLWQHTASVAASTIAQDFGNGSVKSGVGTSAMILGWFGFSLLIIVTIGLLVMLLSMSVLDKLTGD